MPAPKESTAPQRRKPFNMNRAQVVDENFVEFVKQWQLSIPVSERIDPQESITAGSRLTCNVAVELLESQMIARHQDIVAREMRARNEGFYTIASAGHEGNVVLGRITRYSDPAFLHYRAGAFVAERSRQVAGVDCVKDTLLAVAASREDPASGGRHKVWGSKILNIPPQTSTIASHLPKAVGAALLINRSQRLGGNAPRPVDSIVVCSFGDASVSHAVAQTAFNLAVRSAYHRLPTPILFVCEDNGLGISVHTPPDWIESAFSRYPHLHYFQADGLDLVNAFDVSSRAVDYCRRYRRPVFLHLKCVRLLGHAGSDVETEYHSWDQIIATEAKDPLLSSAGLLMSHGVLKPNELLDMYERVRTRVQLAGEHAAQRPKLTSAAEIIKPLAPCSPHAVALEAARPPDHQGRVKIFAQEDQLPEHLPPRHMAAMINWGLHDLLIKYPQAIIFGEDVAQKGGVYHLTADLYKRFGNARVFNTILDETAILGLAGGAGHVGLLPIPEIQYLAYYHNAQDQIRGEACSLQFFSNDQFRNPMVIRIQGWAYQKGFGGHFHNDNSIAALRDVPGLIIATPSRGDDAVQMLRTCLAMAKVDGRVIAFIEPIALYMVKDLYEPKDQQWSFTYPLPGDYIPFGEGRVYHQDNRDLTILTFANGTYMSLRAARTLQQEHNIQARVVDLRWLNPLNEAFIIEQSLATGRVLIVDEGRKTGGVSESIMSLLLEQVGTKVQAARLNAHDTYVPLGTAANLIMPTEEDVVAHALGLLKSVSTQSAS